MRDDGGWDPPRLDEDFVRAALIRESDEEPRPKPSRASLREVKREARRRRKPRRRARRLSVAVILLTALAGGGVASLVALGGEGTPHQIAASPSASPSPSPRPSASPRPAVSPSPSPSYPIGTPAPPRIAETKSLRDADTLSVGDCFILGFADAPRSTVEPLRRRCDTPHLYELAARLDYRARFASKAPSPDERELIYRHDCEAAVVRYTGGVAGDLNSPRLPFRVLYYASHRQIEDDLHVHCIVATVAGRTIAEPMRGWHGRHAARKR